MWQALNKCGQYAPSGPDVQPAASRLAGRRCHKRYWAAFANIL
ncbi:Uncharacterised protein [Halioglobus japonicus]|nr:Uncharacterised protein [Halioglobus japonicus]